MEYKGTADLCDGRQIDVEGTLQQCANWAENVIRASDGEVSIQITRVDEE